MRKPYDQRHLVMSEIVSWMRKNTGVRGASKMPGMPSRATIWRWGRDVPTFARQMAEARAEGLDFVQQARAADRAAFNSALADDVVTQVRYGARIADVARRPQGPSLRRLTAWKKAHPEFRAALRAAVRMARRNRPLPWPWDEATADRILLRVMRGETLPAILREPDMPGPRAMRCWRAAHPDYDTALRRAMVRGQRVRGAAQTGELCTPKLTKRIADRIAAGHSLRSVAGRRGMPSRGTLYGWMKRRPEFAEAVWAACDEREWILREQALMRLDGLSEARIAAVIRSIGGRKQRVSTMPQRPGEKHRGRPHPDAR